MKTINIWILLLGVLTIFACSTTIPSTDNVTPTFQFRITSGFTGGDVTINSTDDFSRMTLRLRPEATYRFTFTGSDEGGLSLLQMQHSNVLQLSRIAPAEAIHREISPINYMLEWIGDRSSPRNGMIITGVIRTENALNSFDVIRFFARDFGGASGDTNESRGDVDLQISTEDEFIRG